MRRKSLVFAVLIMFALSGIAMAEKAGDSNFKTRYGTTSTTPITDIDYLNGVTSNVQTQIDAGGTGTLTDTYVFVGNGSNVATGVAVTATGDATGTLANTGVLNLSQVANSIGTAELNYYVWNVNVVSGATSGTATVPVNSIILGAYAFANINDSTADIMNTVSISGTTVTLTTLGAATDGLEFKVTGIAP